MNIDEQIKELVNQYNKSISKKQEAHDTAQKCLGAIEMLKKLKEEKECQDSGKKVKKT